MQKWGKNRNGSARFRCHHCGVSLTNKRTDLSSKYKQELFQVWLLGKLSLSEISLKYSVSRQTLHSWFLPFWDKEPYPRKVNISGVSLIIDGKYVDRTAAVLIASTPKDVASWHFTQRENNSGWTTFLHTLKEFPFSITCDGQRGMLKAIKYRYPGVTIQRCQFHVVQYCLLKITKKPESSASMELRKIVLLVSSVKTRDGLKYWLSDYKWWYQSHRDFLQEKTYQTNNLTPTGRPKWHYTHGRLHAAHSHLKNALPNLFQYLRYPQIPNTTNFVEGAINSQMQEKLRFHRGLNLTKRRILIAYFLASKQG